MRNITSLGDDINNTRMSLFGTLRARPPNVRPVTHLRSGLQVELSE